MIEYLQRLDYKFYTFWKKNYSLDYIGCNKKIIRLAKQYLDLFGKRLTDGIRDKRGKRVIVTLTSIPSRMDSLPYTIKSIYNQTVEPDFIVLYLAKSDYCGDDELPQSLKKLMGDRLIIEYVDDLKSHKKYYYALCNYPGDIMITIDDDIIYSEKLLFNLLKSYEEHPGSVVCSRSNIIKRFGNKPMAYKTWKGIEDYEKRHLIKNEDIFFTTGGGTLFPNWLLTKESVKRDKFMALTFTADDVWLNYMVRLSNIKVYNTDSLDCHCLFNCYDQEWCLSDYNLGMSGNDKCIRMMDEEYHIEL